MNLERVIQNLTDRVPRAIGAVLCDYEGETVLTALGSTPAPEGARRRALEHVPKALKLSMEVGEFLVRLAGAESCGLLRHFDEGGRRFGAGALFSVEMRYSDIELLVHMLPNDYYLVLLLRRPAAIAEARRHVEVASQRLAEHVA